MALATEGLRVPTHSGAEAPTHATGCSQSLVHKAKVRRGTAAWADSYAHDLLGQNKKPQSVVGSMATVETHRWALLSWTPPPQLFMALN